MAATMEAFERFVETGRMDMPDGERKDAPREPDPDLVALYAKRTGLDQTTCMDLFRQGWIYREQLGKAPVWVHPMEHMLDRAVTS